MRTFIVSIWDGGSSRVWRSRPSPSRIGVQAGAPAAWQSRPFSIVMPANTMTTSAVSVAPAMQSGHW